MAVAPPKLRYPAAELLSPIPSVLQPPLDDPDTMVLNLGPNHPSTHGVLRLVATLNGETVVGLHNELGYVHTGIEKSIESKTYWKHNFFSGFWQRASGCLAGNEKGTITKHCWRTKDRFSTQTC